MNITKKDIDEIKKSCEKNNVKFLHLFGSFLSDKFNSTSDIDLLVDFNDSSPEKYTENYFALKDFLKHYFNREIDLLESRALSNELLIESINQNKVIIYDEK